MLLKKWEEKELPQLSVKVPKKEIYLKTLVYTRTI